MSVSDTVRAEAAVHRVGEFDGKVVRVKTWELLAVALAGFILGGSIVYGLFTLPLEGQWRTVNAALAGLGQILVILHPAGGLRAHPAGLAGRAEPGRGMRAAAGSEPGTPARREGRHAS